MPQIVMEVNGKSVNADVASNTLLVDVLRTNLALTGTHVGCEIGRAHV